MDIKDSIAVLIPVYNSEKTIIKVINELIKVLDKFSDYQIILIDDASQDNSFKLIKENKSKKVTAVRLKKNVGQQLALFYGLRFVESDYTVIMDDDDEQNPADIMTLYLKIKEGYQVVYGLNERQNQKGQVRAIGSLFRDFLFNHLTDKPKEIKVCSFRIMNQETVNHIKKADSKFIYLSMEILKYADRIGNIYVRYNENNHSNYHYVSLFLLFVKIYVYYSRCFIWKHLRKKLEAYEVEEFYN